MRSRKYEILGCPCVALQECEVESFILTVLAQSESGYTVAINAEKIEQFQKDSALSLIIKNSILPYPDGAGAVLGLKLLHGISLKKINMPIKALEAANSNRLKTYVVGASEVNHHLAIQAILKRYPNIDLVGHLHGYHSEDAIVKDVTTAKPQIIMIAMGSPKQEILAAKLIKKNISCVVIGCGGAMDILAGMVKRAPDFMIDNNLEWLYRLCSQPWRLRRQMFLPYFLLRLCVRYLVATFNEKVFGTKSD